MAHTPLYPWVFAAYPVLYIAAANPGQASATGVAMVTLVATLGAAAVLLLARPLSPSWRHAALIAAAVTAVVFAFGPIHAAIDKAVLDAVDGRGKSGLSPLWLDMTLSAAALLILAGCWWRTARLSREAVARLTRALNVTSVVLVALVTAQMVSGSETASSVRREPAVSGATAEAGSTKSRDIYYIVLDGYARQDVLERYYAFDNLDFIRRLRARDFTVSGMSTSNYYWTFLSLASALNFRYVEDIIGEAIDVNETDRSALYHAIRDNAAARFLRQRGYRFVHAQSTWGATRNNPAADAQLRCARSGFFSDEFGRAVADASWLRVIMGRASVDLASCHESNFAAVATLGSAQGPKFVFAHFLVPHHPYLFDREGRVLRNANLSNQFEFQKRLWEDRKAYLEQLRYVNRRMLELVGTVIDRSDVPPIIVIQSDHGPNLRKGIEGSEEMRIRFANLSAHYLPDAPASLIPDDDTPVNLFRRVLNHYFGADLPILPNRRFYSDYRRPFDLREIGTEESGHVPRPP